MDSLVNPDEPSKEIVADQVINDCETKQLSTDISTQEVKQSSTEVKSLEEIVGNAAPVKPFCEPCLFDEMEAIAIAFCVICVEFLCTDCARDHRRSKVTRQHKLLSDEDMPKSSTVFKLMKETTSCPDHPDMVASYECNEHKAFICTTCVAVNHRKCDNVKEVSKYVTTNEDSTREPLLKERLRLLLEKTVTVRMSKEENISALLQDQTEINSKREKFKDKISLHIQDLGEISESETEALLRKEMAKIESDVHICKDLEIEEKKKQELLETTLLHGNPVEISIISSRILNDLQRFEKETEFQNAKAKVRLGFAENARILDQSPLCYISATNGKVELEGSVAQLQMEHSSDICDEEFNATYTHQVSDLDRSEIKIGNDLCRGHMDRAIGRKVTKYDMELQTDDFKCITITSILILNDGRIVIIDEGNAALKVLDADYSVQLTHYLGHKPIDMCEASDNTVAVVFESFQHVKRYVMSDQTIVDNGGFGFSTKLYALSITTFNSQESTVAILFSDEQLATEKNSTHDTIEVQVRNSKNGKIICTLSDFKAKLSKQMNISNPRRIYTVGKEKKRMLIPGEDKLHCFETEGSILKEVWFYKSRGDVLVGNITDVTADGDENVYIVCSESHNIHQISATNFRTNRVLTSKLSRPVSLCVDKTGTQILVGCKEDGYLHVYQFV